MSALTSLLVRDRIVPVSKIEEALQSQVFLGGDIEIILLEMNAVPEDVLSAYRAALFDLLPATRDEVMRATRDAPRRVPPELARSLGIVPIFFEGRTLVVAAWEPLSEARQHEVEAQLGCELSVRIVNRARLAAALAHHYGFELDPRLRRLMDGLRRRDAGVVPYVRPPAPSVRPIPSVEEEEDEARESDETIPANTAGGDDQKDDHEDDQDETSAPEPVPVAAADASHAALESGTGLPAGVSPQLAGLVRGPISLDRATELLKHTAQRDDVLFVLLRYLQRFFDFVCIFAVGKEGARARLAHGAGLGRDQLDQAFVPASKAGLFADAIRQKLAAIGEFGGAAEEQPAAALLHREPGRLGLAVPIELNERVVLLVYADRVRPGLGLEHASTVHAIVPAVTGALRRIILEGKAQRRAGPDSAASPPVASGTGSRDGGAKLAPRTGASEGEDAALSAVDLDKIERVSDEAGRRGPTRAAARPEVDSRESTLLRERIAGVPRAAPMPPAYEAATAPPTNGYRYRANAGLAHERAQGVELAGPAAAHEREAAAAPARALDSELAQRQRLSLVEATGEVPSVIIDMGENVDALIESLLRTPPGSEPREIEELLRIGESVLPVLMQHFPGPLWFDRRKPHKRLPRGRDVSAVARAVVAFGEGAAPYVASLLGTSDADRCYYLLLLAGELVHPDLIDPVARRVLDREDGMRALALSVLRGYSVLPQYDAVLRALSDLAERSGKDARRQRLAVEALGELRDGRALTTLLARLADPDPEVARAAHRALVVLTAQDFGLVPRKWETWAEGWGRAHRVEWLIESLLHNEEHIRALAGEELKQLTQQYFGYHPSLPRRDRELAQRKYREWWELEGRVAVGR